MIKAIKQSKWYRKLGSSLFKELIFEAEDRGYRNALIQENHQNNLGRESYFKYLIEKEVIIIDRLGTVITGILSRISKTKDGRYVKYLYHLGERIHEGFIIEYSHNRFLSINRLTSDERKDLFMKKIVIN